MRPMVPDTFMARKKGDVISQAELIPLVGCGPSQARYGLRLCKIAELMMAKWRQAGDPRMVVQAKNQLKILTDAEASVYNRNSSDGAVRALRRSHRRECEVRTATFSDRQREEHDRHLQVTGLRVAMTSPGMINRVAKLAPHERLLPGVKTYRNR